MNISKVYDDYHFIIEQLKQNPDFIFTEYKKYTEDNPEHYNKFVYQGVDGKALINEITGGYRIDLELYQASNGIPFQYVYIKPSANAYDVFCTFGRPFYGTVAELPHFIVEAISKSVADYKVREQSRVKNLSKA